MGREESTVEYLGRLVEWAGGRAEFCKRTGIKSANLSAYLSRDKGVRKNIGWKRLKSATGQVFGQPPAFHPVIEGYDLMANGSPKPTDLPAEPGIYALFDSAMRVIYFGKATSLYAEIRQTLKRKLGEVRPWTGKKDLTFGDITTYISAYTIIRGDADFRHDIEALGLRVMVNNTFNKNGASFKRTD